MSDKPDTPLAFTFPSGTTIRAGEHMIVFASKQQSTASEFHTGFALSKNGDTVVLASPDGNILQKIELPTLGNDVTYGRTPDGGDTFEIMSPTPAKANAAAVSAPVFSAPSGFYLNDWKAGDFNSNKKLDVFDLCLMKRELFGKKNSL